MELITTFIGAFIIGAVIGALLVYIGVLIALKLFD